VDGRLLADQPGPVAVTGSVPRRSWTGRLRHAARGFFAHGLGAPATPVLSLRLRGQCPERLTPRRSTAANFLTSANAAVQRAPGWSLEAPYQAFLSGVVVGRPDTWAGLFVSHGAYVDKTFFVVELFCFLSRSGLAFGTGRCAGAVYAGWTRNHIAASRTRPARGTRRRSSVGWPACLVLRLAAGYGHTKVTGATSTTRQT